MPRKPPPVIPRDARHIGEIVIAELPPERQLGVWVAAHGTSLAALAAELEIDHAQLSRVARGVTASRPIVEAVAKRTGVLIGSR